MKRWREDEIEDAVRQGDVAAIARILGFSEPLVPVAPSVRAMWGWTHAHPELGIRATSAGAARLVVVEGRDRAPLRDLVRQSHRHNPEAPILFVFVAPSELVFATAHRPESNPDTRVRVRTMAIDRARPDAIGIEQVRELSVAAVAAPDLRDSARAVARHFAEALDQEGLAREFFRGFASAVELLAEQMQGGPDDPRGRHDVALTTMLRLVFLYLLQRKGALDADPWFVMRRVRQARADHSDPYRDCLRPLFFGLLNTPPHARETAASRLGAVPFLNGGLFEPLPVERAHPELTWPRRVWDDVFEGLLERFHFTAREVSDETYRAVDPEMLGKVFEGLMFGDERANSGSFYTPREVVREMVDDALHTWLSEISGVARSRLDAPDEEFSADERDRLLNAVTTVRVLDPAVGTGAFLLDALRALANWHARLTGEPTTYETMRGIIHRSLYGVDLQPTAVRLCTLRLWLALMTTLPEGVSVGDIPPLPNLAHRVATGNALLDSSDHASLAIDGRRFVVESAETAALRAQLAELDARYLVSHGDEKHRVSKALRACEAKLERSLIDARVARLQQLAAPLREVAAGLDLFGEQVALDLDQARTLEALEAEIGRLAEKREELKAGRAAARRFDFSTRFASAMGNGGFDLVVTNPPWVRTHRIDRDQRALLKSRYGAASNELWPQASVLGVRAPFGTQVDLAALFLERSMELLRPGGRLAALVPAKLLRSLHGASIRRILAEHDIERIDDHSDARDSMFDATTYPAYMLVRKAARGRRRSTRARRSARVSVARGDVLSRWTTTHDDIVGTHPARPWLLVEPDLARIFDDMWAHAKPLGMLPELAPTRGIFTGCNDVFLRPTGEFSQLLGDAARDHVRPVLAGRDLDDDGFTTTAEILWLYNDQMELLAQPPDAVAAYFREHEERLLGRSDHVSTLPLWQVFRAKPELLGPKVVWPDIATELRAEVVPANVVPLNTTYVIPCTSDWQAHRVAALLNSEPVRAYCRALAERARGGFRRHFAWVIRMLPVPRDFADWTPQSPHRGDWPAEITALFGLSRHDEAALAAWRRGDEVGRTSEVAA